MMQKHVDGAVCINIIDRGAWGALQALDPRGEGASGWCWEDKDGRVWADGL